MMADRPKVLLSFPTSPANPYLHKWVVAASWRLLSDKRYDIKPILPSHNPFENNLNRIVRDFVEGDYEFWLSMDADNPPLAGGNPLDAIAFDKDIIGFPTPVWHYEGKVPGERPLYYNGYVKSTESDGYKENQIRQGLVEVDAVGTGCFLVARRVFDHPDMLKGPFLRVYNEYGIVERGNDIAFCERAKAAGFRIWCDYDRPCMHFNELELNEVVQAFVGLYEDGAQ